MRALAALVFLAGCNSILGISDPTLVDDSGGDEVDAGADEVDAPVEDEVDAAPPGPDAAPPILGIMGDVLHGETSTSRRSPDYSLIRARFPSGGGFRDYAGAIGEDGRFIIPDVASQGEYMLEVRADVDCYGRCAVGYLVTGARSDIDLGLDWIGRDPQNLDGSARLLVTAGGLDPFSPTNHRLDLLVPNVGWGSESPNQPALGATSLASFPIPWEFYGALEVAAGDRVTLVQWGPQQSTPLSHRKIVKAFTFSADVKPGDNPVSGTFTAPAMTHTLAADWRRSEFETLLGGACPPGTRDASQTHAINVLVKPTPTLFLSFLGVAGFSLLRLDESDATDVNATFSVPDPLPVPWPRVRQTYAQAVCSFDLGGPSPATHVLSVNTEVDLAASGPIRPLVGPPRALRVDGNDATAPRSTGRQLELSWSPPQSGTPDRYLVELYQYFPTAEQTIFAGARFMLKASATPKLIVPEGILRSGDRYWLIVTAISGGTDFDRVPLRFAHPFASASAMTAVLTAGP